MQPFLIVLWIQGARIVIPVTAESETSVRTLAEHMCPVHPGNWFEVRPGEVFTG